MSEEKDIRYQVSIDQPLGSPKYDGANIDVTKIPDYIYAETLDEIVAQYMDWVKEAVLVEFAQIDDSEKIGWFNKMKWHQNISQDDMTPQIYIHDRYEYGVLDNSKWVDTESANEIRDYAVDCPDCGLELCVCHVMTQVVDSPQPQPKSRLPWTGEEKFTYDTKPAWKRTVDNIIFADFLDGNGIMRTNKQKAKNTPSELIEWSKEESSKGLFVYVHSTFSDEQIILQSSYCASLKKLKLSKSQSDRIREYYSDLTQWEGII